MTQTNAPLLRVRIKFSKTEAMRYTSHLDLFRTWERTLRRAKLALAYSHGYNPRPRINLAAALPLGFTSQCEVADVWLEEHHPLAEIYAALERASPPGIQILHLEEVDLSAPALQTQVMSSEYIATLLDPLPDLDARLEKLHSAERLLRRWRGKLYDLRPLIEDLRRLPDMLEDYQQLHMRLSAREAATGRPEEVLNALGIPPETTRVCRINMIFVQ